MNVKIAVGGLIDISTRVVPPIKCIRRWPAVMLAVSRTANAIGWIKRLIVSMIISIGISGIGVPCGRKWANDALVLWRNPVITAPAHRGMAIPKFIDSWVVGVKEWGNKPRRLVEPINIISEINIRDQVRPFGLCIVIICFNTSWINHCWADTRRLFTSRDGEGKSRLGNIIIKRTIGRPISVGVMKEANRFSFIFLLKGFFSQLV